MANTPGITVKVNVDSEALRSDISKLVLRYSEWLDSEELIVGDDQGDTRSHEELVSDFFASADD